MPTIKRILRGLCPLFFILWFSSCQSNKINTLSGQAQGTTFVIKYTGEEKLNLDQKISRLLQNIDWAVSHYDKNSLVSQINDNKVRQLDLDTSEISQIFFQVLGHSISMRKESNGYFDHEIAPLVNYWGFGKIGRKKMDEMADSNYIKVLLTLKEKHMAIKINDQVKSCIKLDTAARLDFNAIAQGYSIDLIAQLMDHHNIENYLIELGGEAKVKGNKHNKPWVFGIESPNETTDFIKKIALKNNRALATSGSYRKYITLRGEKYAHTINPFTGQALKSNLLSVSVIAQDCYKADALATAFLIMGEEKIKKWIDRHPSENIALYLISSNKEGDFRETYFGNFQQTIVKD